MKYRFKILGITIFKKEIQPNYINYFLLGIKVWEKKNELYKIIKQFDIKGSFDCQALDNQIAEIAYATQNIDSVDKVNARSILFLASEFYENGGHTKCVLNLVKILKREYDCNIFLTRKINTYNCTKSILDEMAKYANIDGCYFDFEKYKETIKKSFDKIVEIAPKIIFVFSHMDDIYSTMLLALIKKHTKIKIIYFNHGSHYAALGFTFADLVIEGMPITHYVTKHFRKLDKCHVIGLIDKPKDEIEYILPTKKEEILKELGLKVDDLVLTSGGAGHKFFNGEKSDYFQMIKEILEINSKIKCVIFSEFNKNENTIIKNIFNNLALQERLIIKPFSKNYSKYFQVADVYVDSFPIGGALIQAELMGLKVPTVVKINKENALISFHEYFAKDYPYMFENVEDMKNGILELLFDVEKRKQAVDINYNHYLETFEAEAVKQKYVKIIENSDNLEQFYDKLDESLVYNLRI